MASNGASEKELLRKGVEALQAGDRATASQLLSDVVDMNPLNEQAWFYLAAAEPDPFMRKRYLQRVLELNPNNSRAHDVLARIEERERAAKPADTSPKPPLGLQRISTPTTQKSMPPVYVPDPEPTTMPPSNSPTPIQSPVFSSPASTPRDDEELPDFNALTAAPKTTSVASAVSIESMDDLRSLGSSGKPEKSPASENAPRTKLKVLSPDSGSMLGAVNGEGGFPLPFNISGSPARVSLGSIGKAGVTLLRTGINILRHQPDVYAHEIERVTWWRLLLYTVFTGLISTIAVTVIVAIQEAWLSTNVTSYTVNLFSPILTLLLGIPFFIGTMLGGAGVSWVIFRFFGERLQLTQRQPYLKHAYMIAVVWFPLSIVVSVIALVLNIIGWAWFSIVTTMSIAVYSVLTIDQGVEHLYGVHDIRSKQIAAGIAIGGVFIARLLIGAILTAITGAATWVFVFS